jgi:protein-S-isoprenylcysteine O-methyltransferase Ste14
MAFLVLAAAAFAATVYTLFFALPFSDTYVSQQVNTVCDRGMYALCRHPGVLWLTLTYLFLAIAWGNGQVWRLGVLYSCLNLGYVWIQDRWTFPRTFPDYPAYRKQTPFLIPTAQSIQCAWQTRR